MKRSASPLSDHRVTQALPPPASTLPTPDDASWLQALVNTLAQIVRDKGVFLLLVGAPLLYAFFYPWIYQVGVVREVPVAVVDMDQSALSRQFIRLADATPHIAVTQVLPDRHSAEQALWRGEIEGFAILPRELSRDVSRMEQAVIDIEANGAYPLLNKSVQTGFVAAATALSVGVKQARFQAKGLSADQAAVAAQPLTLQSQPLFNPTEHYGSFIVPAVSILILQQTLLMGAALLAGSWAELGRARVRPRLWLGRWAALSMVGWLVGMAYFGWVFWFQDFPRGQNLSAALAMLGVFSPAVAALGLWIGLILRDRERALQVLLFTALPLAFVAGFSWPAHSMPEALQWLRWLSPSTSGVEAAVRLNQLGASLHDVLPYLWTLLALTVVSLSGVLWVGRLRDPSPAASA